MYESFKCRLTRAEKIQFFQLTSNDDDIHNRFKKKEMLIIYQNLKHI